MLSEIIRQVKNVAHGGVGGWGAEIQALRLGAIRDSDIGIIHWHNPSGSNMALGSTQTQTNLSNSTISWFKGGHCIGQTS